MTSLLAPWGSLCSRRGQPLTRLAFPGLVTVAASVVAAAGASTDKFLLLVMTKQLVEQVPLLLILRVEEACNGSMLELVEQRDLLYWIIFKNLLFVAHRKRAGPPKEPDPIPLLAQRCPGSATLTGHVACLPVA